MYHPPANSMTETKRTKQSFWLTCKLSIIAFAFLGLFQQVAMAHSTTKPVTKKAVVKAKKTAAKAKKTVVKAKKTAAKAKKTATKAKKTAKLTKIETQWQLDAWETHFRAAWVYYVLVEWKKYTRTPKISTKEAFAVVTKLRKDKVFFSLLQRARKQFSKAKHPVTRRRIEMLWEQLREYHLSAEINEIRGQIHTLTDKLNGIQASFRATYKGKKMSNRDLGQIIRHNVNRKEREAAWRAYASVGPKVLRGGFMQLIRLRNKYAKKLGFKSFFHYRYHKLKLDPKKMWKLYESLRTETLSAKGQPLAAYRKLLTVKKIMPWDSKYARHVRSKRVIDLDIFLSAKKLLPILFKAYKELGFHLKTMNIKMDLYPRANKNQHAYCFDIDPPHDIRILANVGRAGMRPYETLFHEMGHAVHGKLVKQPISTFRALPDEGFLNEGSANFFGNIINTKEFFAKYLNIPAKTMTKVIAMKRSFLAQRMYLIRSTMMWMYFERDLYTTHAHLADPSKQFWKRYAQFIGEKPKNAPPYWGILIHFVSHPIYYQNYLLADMLAAQLHEAVKKKTGRNYIFGNNRVAKFMTKNFFSKGRRYQWDVLLKRVTGQSLNAAAYLKSLKTAWK